MADSVQVSFHHEGSATQYFDEGQLCPGPATEPATPVILDSFGTSYKGSNNPGWDNNDTECDDSAESGDVIEYDSSRTSSSLYGDGSEGEHFIYLNILLLLLIILDNPFVLDDDDVRKTNLKGDHPSPIDGTSSQSGKLEGSSRNTPCRGWFQRRPESGPPSSPIPQDDATPSTLEASDHLFTLSQTPANKREAQQPLGNSFKRCCLHSPSDASPEGLALDKEKVSVNGREKSRRVTALGARYSKPVEYKWNRLHGYRVQDGQEQVRVEWADSWESAGQFPSFEVAKWKQVWEREQKRGMMLNGV
jgi:hypothetical protein